MTDKMAAEEVEEESPSENTTRASRAPQQARIDRELAKEHPDRPFLELFEPLPLRERFGNTWNEKLKFLYEFTPVTPDMLAERLGLNRSGVWRWTSREDLKASQLEATAQAFGFDPGLWFATTDIVDFANQIFASNPNFGVNFAKEETTGATIEQGH